jgi:hypothetical protein
MRNTLTLAVLLFVGIAQSVAQDFQFTLGPAMSDQTEKPRMTCRFSLKR